MFPCKVKIDELDKTNTKVANVEFSSNKNETKAQIKKVAAKGGEKTPFYFIADYFEKNGKSVGDFLTLGNSPKLEKHFVQNEMKKSTSSLMGKNQDEKKASMGELYVKDLNGKPTIHFEPHDKCKIPGGKWPKILKSMKAYFGGLKAVVVLGGELIQEEEGENEGGENENEATTSASDDSAATTTKAPTVQELADDYKEMLATFKEVQKAEHDVEDVKNLYRTLIAWEKNYQKLEKAAQEKLEKFYQSFDATRSEVKKILKVDQGIGEDVEKVTKMLTEYVALDEDSAAATKIRGEATVVLAKLAKFCEFVSAKKLTAKVKQLQQLLEA